MRRHGYARGYPTAAFRWMVAAGFRSPFDPQFPADVAAFMHYANDAMTRNARLRRIGGTASTPHPRPLDDRRRNATICLSSQFRACGRLGIITPETTTFLVQLGHVEQNVSVHLRRFPNGGSWSLVWMPDVRQVGEDAAAASRRYCLPWLLQAARSALARLTMSVSGSVRSIGSRSFAPCWRATSRCGSSHRLCGARWSGVRGLRRGCASASFVRLRCDLRGKLKPLSILVMSLILSRRSGPGPD